MARRRTLSLVDKSRRAPALRLSRNLAIEVPFRTIPRRATSGLLLQTCLRQAWLKPAVPIVLSTLVFVFVASASLAFLVRADEPAIPAGFRPFTPRRALVSNSSLSNSELLTQLQRPTWVLAVGNSSDPLRIGSPWHHPAITELVSRCQADQELRRELLASLRAMLQHPSGTEDRNTVSEQRFNAAVALALLDDPTGFGELDKVFVDANARLEKRTTAIFALATEPTRLNARRLHTLLDAWLPSAHFGPVVTPQKAEGASGQSASRLRQPEELVAGVFWAVVRAEQSRGGYTAANDPLLARAAGAGGVLLRRVVAIAFVGQTWNAPPSVLADLLRDPSPQVRQTALAAITVHPHAAVGPLVLAASHDAEHEVRLVAIARLPFCAKDAAASRLQEILAGKSAAERAAAVGAAAKLQLWNIVERGAGDESHVVRAAAGAALAAMPGENAFETLRKLLADRSTQVQIAAVEALAQRPAAQVGAGLLDALESPTLQTRQRAWELLTACWAPAAAFPIHAPLDERSDRLNDLRRQWRSQTDAARFQRLRSPDAPGLPPVGRSADDEPIGTEQAADSTVRAEEVARLVTEWYRNGSTNREVLAKRLLSMGPEVVPVIEEFLHSRDACPDDGLLQQVLAELDPIYRGLALLGEPSVPRPTALQVLVRELQQRRLSAMQAIVLTERLRVDADTATWLALVDRLEHDAPAEAAALDALALARPEAAIRLDACKRMSRRIEPRHADMLAGVFNDSNLAVRRVALRAAGRTQAPALSAALRQAMHTPDARTRLAAAAGLCDLGDTDAAAELERLAAHADPQIRRAAVEEIVNGTLLDRAQAVRVFRRALDDPRIEVQRLAVTGLEQRTGARAERPATGGSQPLPEQIAGWKRLLDSKAPTLLAN